MIDLNNSEASCQLCGETERRACVRWRGEESFRTVYGGRLPDRCLEVLRQIGVKPPVVVSPSGTNIGQQTARCGGCNGNVRIKLHSRMTAASVLKLIDQSKEDWPEGWQDWPGVLEAYRSLGRSEELCQENPISG